MYYGLAVRPQEPALAKPHPDGARPVLAKLADDGALCVPHQLRPFLRLVGDQRGPAAGQCKGEDDGKDEAYRFHGICIRLRS